MNCSPQPAAMTFGEPFQRNVTPTQQRPSFPRGPITLTATEINNKCLASAQSRPNNRANIPQHTLDPYARGSSSEISTKARARSSANSPKGRAKLATPLARARYAKDLNHFTPAIQRGANVYHNLPAAGVAAVVARFGIHV